MATIPKRLFHYSRGHYFLSIIAAGKILPSIRCLQPQEKPVVWLSYRADYEPSALPGYRTADGLRIVPLDVHALNETVLRFEVDPKLAPLDWLEWCKLSGADSKTIKQVQASAILFGSNVLDWRMSFEPVTSDNWITVELFVGGQWFDIGDIIHSKSPTETKTAPA